MRTSVLRIFKLCAYAALFYGLLFAVGILGDAAARDEPPSVQTESLGLFPQHHASGRMTGQEELCQDQSARLVARQIRLSQEGRAALPFDRNRVYDQLVTVFTQCMIDHDAFQELVARYNGL